MTIERVIAVLRERPQGSEIHVVGYFNAELAQPEGAIQEEEIEAAFAEAVLEDMLAHFLPQRHHWCQYRRTWIMVILGRKLQSQKDYILGTYCRLFRNVSVRYLRHNSDHYMVLDYLRSTPLREYTKYLKRHTRIPIQPPTTPTRKDGIFIDLRRATPKPKGGEARNNTWTPEATCRLIDKRVSATRDPA